MFYLSCILLYLGNLKLQINQFIVLLKLMTSLQVLITLCFCKFFVFQYFIVSMVGQLIFIFKRFLTHSGDHFIDISTLLLYFYICLY